MTFSTLHCWTFSPLTFPKSQTSNTYWTVLTTKNSSFIHKTKACMKLLSEECKPNFMSEVNMIFRLIKFTYTSATFTSMPTLKLKRTLNTWILSTNTQKSSDALSWTWAYFRSLDKLKKFSQLSSTVKLMIAVCLKRQMISIF